MTKYALTGKKRSGKDTVASMLQNLHPELTTYALASPIKTVINILFGVDEATIESTRDLEMTHTINLANLTEAGYTYTLLVKEHADQAPLFHEFWDMIEERGLIHFDTQRGVYHYTGKLRLMYQLFGTEFGRSVNEDLWLILAPDSAGIITDVRFENEALWFRNKGRAIVEVYRKNDDATETHASEAGVPSELVHVLVPNLGTLADLEKLVVILDNEVDKLLN
jgi:hypothetical protein